MPPDMIAGQPPKVLAALDEVAPTLAYDLALSQTGAVDRELLAVTLPVQVCRATPAAAGWAVGQRR